MLYGILFFLCRKFGKIEINISLHAKFLCFLYIYIYIILLPFKGSD